jgi:hypothetical protein
MDTIRGKVLEVSNDYENVFHITVEAEIPDGVALARFNLSSFGANPNANIAARLPNEPFRLIATTIGEPALKVADFVTIDVFYHNEVIQKGGQTVPISETL